MACDRAVLRAILHYENMPSKECQKKIQSILARSPFLGHCSIALLPCLGSTGDSVLALLRSVHRLTFGALLCTVFNTDSSHPTPLLLLHLLLRFSILGLHY